MRSRSEATTLRRSATIDIARAQTFCREATPVPAARRVSLPLLQYGGKKFLPGADTLVPCAHRAFVRPAGYPLAADP